MDLLIQSPDELLAAIPHVLGFKPEDSLVVVPFGPGLPIARVDLPKTARDLDEVWDALRGPYGRHARPGARVGIVCITDDRTNAELASLLLPSRLEADGVATHVRLWADGERWHDFNSGAAGLQTQEAADRIAATTVLAGTVQPAANRASLAASLVGAVNPSPRSSTQAAPPRPRAPPAQSATGLSTALSGSTPTEIASPTPRAPGCWWRWSR